MQVSETSPKQLIDSAIEPITILLKESGFKKVNRRFYKDTGEARIFLEVQASQWSRGEEASFTINLAVFNPLVMCKLERKTTTTPTSMNECTWHERIGFTMPEHLDVWWKVTKLNSDEVAKEIENIVINYGLPWLEKMADYEGFCEVLTKSGGVGAANILWSLERYEQAIACIKNTSQNTTSRINAVSDWLKSHML